MKYMLLLTFALAAAHAADRKPSQSSSLHDRIRSEFGLDLPCHYQLTGDGVQARLVDIQKEMPLEACKEEAAKALQKSPASYRQARVKSSESMEWFVLTRK